MTVFSSQEVAHQLEALYTTMDIAAQRQATIDALHPQPGEHILDVGSGPGLLTLQIAAEVAPNGSVTGVDVSTDMIKLAQSRQKDTSCRQCVNFQEGDAVSLPFGDATFDAAVSTQVYEYVNGLTEAFNELYRVLRPGGRVVIIDTDWDSAIWQVDDRSLMTRVMDTWKSRFAHPYLPRTLRRRLREAGFINQQTSSLTILNTDYNDTAYSIRHLPIMIRFLVQNGLSESDVTRWVKDLERQGSQGAYFFSLNRYLFVASKPSPTKVS
jgi:arsenite methyltransferase